VALDDEIEPDLEDLGVGRVRIRVRERVSRGRELLEQAARDRDVDPAQLGRLRFHDRRRGQKVAPSDSSLLGCEFRIGTHLVGWPTSRKGQIRRRERHQDRGDDGPLRRRLGSELGHDVLRIAPRRAEEPRDDLERVLVCDDLRQLEDGRDAERPRPEVVEHLREALHELDRGLPVGGRAVREPEILHEEGEERGVPEVGPAARAVEGREGGQKLRERVLLAAEELDEKVGLPACGGHSRILACDFEPSWKARIRALPRDRDTPSRTPRPARRRASGAAWRTERRGQRGP
jgi:hypothetical protein